MSALLAFVRAFLFDSLDVLLSTKHASVKVCRFTDPERPEKCGMGRCELGSEIWTVYLE